MTAEEVYLIVETILDESCPCFFENEVENYSNYVIDKLEINEDQH